MPFLYAVLAIFDDTIKAMLQVPLLAFFLVGMLTFAALGLVLLLKDAVSDGRNRR